LNCKTSLVKKISEVVEIMAERRISRTERPLPDSVKGEEEPTISPPRRTKKQDKPMLDKQLTRWIEKT
jgi:hypothetical protein